VAVHLGGGGVFVAAGDGLGDGVVVVVDLVVEASPQGGAAEVGLQDGEDRLGGDAQ